jgi:hypothetical protein
MIVDYASEMEGISRVLGKELRAGARLCLVARASSNPGRRAVYAKLFSLCKQELLDCRK